MQFTLIYPLLLIWMTFEAGWNLFQRRLPVWFSLIPLGAGLVYLATTGQTWLAAIIALAVMATEIDAHPLRLVGALLAVMLITLLSPEHLPLAVGWMAFVALWEVRALYGADALAGLVLLIFFPSWFMLACIGIGLGLWALIVLAARYKRGFSLRLWTVLANRTRGTTYPAIGGFVLALVVYALLLGKGDIWA
ncbi:MAG: hypothetical protein H8D34_21910 [Chloroflexi bacterium]|nr:hypothetical protein [Chloroflexota bacterium]